MRDALVFDLDDTLFPESEFVLSGFRAVSDWLLANRDVIRFYEVAAGLFRQGVRGNIFDRSLQELGVAFDSELIASLVQIYRAHEPDIELHEDARWAIAHYKASHRLGLITDGYLETQRNKIRALRLESAFDALICTDEFGRSHWKPSRKPYLEMMRRLDCPPSACVYVGDNPSKDFIAAKELGWTTIRICRGEYSDLKAASDGEAHFRIRTLFELEQYVTTAKDVTAQCRH